MCEWKRGCELRSGERKLFHVRVLQRLVLLGKDKDKQSMYKNSRNIRNTSFNHLPDNLGITNLLRLISFSTEDSLLAGVH